MASIRIGKIIGFITNSTDPQGKAVASTEKSYHAARARYCSCYYETLFQLPDGAEERQLGMHRDTWVGQTAYRYLCKKYSKPHWVTSWPNRDTTDEDECRFCDRTF